MVDQNIKFETIVSLPSSTTWHFCFKILEWLPFPEVWGITKEVNLSLIVCFVFSSLTLNIIHFNRLAFNAIYMDFFLTGKYFKTLQISLKIIFLPDKLISMWRHIVEIWRTRERRRGGSFLSEPLLCLFSGYLIQISRTLALRGGEENHGFIIMC